MKYRLYSTVRLNDGRGGIVIDVKDNKGAIEDEYGIEVPTPEGEEYYDWF